MDFTIADYVADFRAPTPSAAAEIAAPDCNELLQKLARQKQQIIRLMQNIFMTTTKHLHWVQKHLSQLHPKKRLLEKMQRLDFCELTLVQLQTRLLNKLQTRSKEAEARLHRLTPLHRIHQLQHQLHFYQQKLSANTSRQVTRKQTELANLAAKLDGLSPLATLNEVCHCNDRINGYRDAKEVKQGDAINVR